MKALIGLTIVAAHAAGFVWLAQHTRGTELTVDVSTTHLVGGPGLVRQRWTTRYRGGFEHTVGVTQLLGPFQDPAKPACTGRIAIGQAFLTDSLAPVMQKVIEDQLRGQDIFPIGKYRRISGLKLAWAEPAAHLKDLGLLGKAGAPHGYIRASARVAFDRVDVPVTVALIPEPSTTEMKFRIAARADLDFKNSVMQWISDKVGANEIATKIARQEIDSVLVTTFAAPPPFDLGGGQVLQFTYCDGPVDIAEGEYGALPFGVAIQGGPILPPQFGQAVRARPAASTMLAIDLDIDALNALLFELWRTGWLDARLADVGLDRRFNNDPTVTQYLAIRISPVKLALPPVISPGTAGSLRLAADARVAIGDDSHSTVGRVYGALDFKLGAGLRPAVDLGGLELDCERTATLLVPCYGDLVATLRDRGSDFHGALTNAFAKLVADIFVNRHLSTDNVPADLVIYSATASLAGPATLHLELTGKLAPAP